MDIESPDKVYKITMDEREYRYLLLFLEVLADNKDNISNDEMDKYDWEEFDDIYSQLRGSR